MSCISLRFLRGNIIFSVISAFTCTRICNFARDEQILLSSGGIPGGGDMGDDVRVHKAAAQRRTDGSADLRVAVRGGLYPAAGLFADEMEFQMVQRFVEGRVADDGAGRGRRFAVFPDGEQRDDLYDDDQHVADRMPLSAVRGLDHLPLLPLGTASRHSDCRLNLGGPGRDRRGAQRPFRAPPLAAGRLAGIRGLSLLGSLFAADDTCQQAL